MNSNSAEKLLPVISDEQKLEISLVDGKAVISLSTWNADLGWCGQKTMPIDVGMLDDLHRAIAAARYRVKQQMSEDAAPPSRVLDFPKFDEVLPGA